MNRRRFAITAATGIAVVSTPTAYYLLRDIEYDSKLAEPHLLSQIWNTETIIEVGRKYRTLIPEEEKERRLVRLLLKGISSDNADFPVQIADKIRQDYTNGNMILVDGWSLSVTEARQCALFSIIHTTN